MSFIFIFPLFLYLSVCRSGVLYSFAWLLCFEQWKVLETFFSSQHQFVSVLVHVFYFLLSSRLCPDRKCQSSSDSQAGLTGPTPWLRRTSLALLALRLRELLWVWAFTSHFTVLHGPDAAK